ncbi:hypothetical protein H6P81_014341 [Aristolochia fimbriata]|uniref:AB hydrolase-1 domain-containing protein n=1 Tax=Aristolochia fimbriata TaxID=158543 RepID=A0AAV7EHH2_ARIFI|nr:hypothetical protein H6P81_014341 [Aristolochia fimbriata]
MPFCVVGEYQQGVGGERMISDDGIRIFYHLYGRGRTKVLFISGLASTHECWSPQLRGLLGTDKPNDDDGSGCIDERDEEEDGIQVCAFDNRGVGQSSIPMKKSDYTTTIMAQDALALMDHLGWSKAHVVGHSMGAMISCKLAAMVPKRVSSLALLNATGGGYECFPKIDKLMISILFRFIRAKTPEQRAAVDLDTHYSKEYLDEYVGSDTRRKILYQEYVKAISSSGMQSNYGFDGQMSACWNHSMSSKELEAIRSAGFPVSVIHGRYDIIARLCHAQKLAEKLKPAARMVELHGAHLVSHERFEEVNQALLDLIQASETKMSLQVWSNSYGDQVDWQAAGLSVSLKRRILRHFKPVRVGSAES